MEIVALIPARGGSKGIPRKNVAPLAGKPLLAWTVEAARASRLVGRVVVSTDSAEVAEVARTHGAEVLDRPAELAGDEVPMRAVVEHALPRLAPVDVLVLLQPTSPLRRPDHVDAALRVLLEDDRRDGVVSVVEVPHAFRPESLMELDGGSVRPLAPGGATRRQDKAPVYARNGPAILALRADRIGPDLYGGRLAPYVMAPLDSVDVDGPDDLRLAELLLRSSRP